jgi:hypothetical protein
VKETPGVARLEKNFPRCSFGYSLRLLLLQLLPRVCSPDNWRDVVSHPPPTGSYSKLEWRQRFPSPDIPCAGDRPRTTNIVVVVCSWPKRGRTVGSCGTT